MTNILLIGGGVIALVLLVVGIVVSASGDKTSMDDRLNKYLEEDKKTETKESKGALT
ncbi:MAG: hypothetical protein IMZ73_00005, partial [Chloroflexi bacterium]|nr:hypothetical protein [Chloroflexota bacterium]